MLDDVADRLYGLPLEEFTAARDAAAKADRAHAATIRGWRKPTASAWLINRLVRSDPALLHDLTALGDALHAAQAERDGQRLRALAEERSRLVGHVVECAAQLAPGPVTASTRAELAGTLEAALVDPGSRDAVRSGRLVRALSFAGFGGVDLEGATAAAPVTRTPAASPRRQRTARESGPDLRAAEQDALAAMGALDDAVRRHAAARSRAGAAQDDAAGAQAAVTQLQTQLSLAQEAAAAADSQRAEAEEALTTAGQALEEAQMAAEHARAALDALRRGG